jgi:hypothetical protein
MKKIIVILFVAFATIMNAQSPATDLLGGGGFTFVDAPPTYTRTLTDAAFSWDVTNNKLYYNSTAGSTWTEFKKFPALVSNGLTLDGDTLQFGGTLNANTSLNIHGKVLTLDGESISGSQVSVTNGAYLYTNDLKLGETNNSTSGVISDVTVNAAYTIPAGIDEQIKFIMNNSGSSFVITPNGAETIGGSATYTLANGDALMLTYDATSTDWRILASDIAAGSASNIMTTDLTSTAARTQTLVDNTASAMSFGATGATGIFSITTTNAAESVSFGYAVSITGDLTTAGNATLGDAAADVLTVNSNAPVFTNLQGFASKTAAEAALGTNVQYYLTAANTHGLPAGTLMLAL